MAFQLGIPGRGCQRDGSFQFATRALVAISIAMTIGVVQADERSAKAAREVLSIALDNIQRGRCGNTPCAPATAAEKASPPIADAQAEAIVAAGLLSGFAEHCNLDWQGKSFSPLMRGLRTIHGFSERQMAIAGIMHGYMQHTTKDGLVKSQKPCTEQMRAETEKSLAMAAPPPKQ